MKWVDDFLVIWLPGQTWTEEDFTSLTKNIGVPWSHAKTRPFASVQQYIGFDWNLASKSVTLLAEKLKSIPHLVSCWCMGEATFSAPKAVSLHGKLVHVSSIFTLIHPFLHLIVHFVTSFTTQEHTSILQLMSVPISPGSISFYKHHHILPHYLHLIQ